MTATTSSAHPAAPSQPERDTKPVSRMSRLGWTWTEVVLVALSVVSLIFSISGVLITVTS